MSNKVVLVHLFLPSSRTTVPKLVSRCSFTPACSSALRTFLFFLNQLRYLFSHPLGGRFCLDHHSSSFCLFCQKGSVDSLVVIGSVWIGNEQRRGPLERITWSIVPAPDRHTATSAAA